MAVKSIDVTFQWLETGTGAQAEVQVLNALLNFDLPVSGNVIIRNIRGACWTTNPPSSITANESNAGRPIFQIRFGLRRDFAQYQFQEAGGRINYGGTGIQLLQSGASEYQLSSSSPNIENINFLGTGITILQAGFVMSNTVANTLINWIVSIEFEEC